MTPTHRPASWIGLLDGTVRFFVAGLAIILGLVLISGVGIILGFPFALQDHVIDVPLDAEAARTVPDLLPPGTELYGNTQVVVADPSPVQAALWLVLHATEVSLWLAGAVLLSRTVRSARWEGPFTRTVARRLRALGMLAVLGGLGTAVLNLGVGSALTALVLADGAFYTIVDVPLAVVLLGLAVLAISEIVHHGVDLREDAEATI
ncbi:DUF2975 domain-containing protein [Nocardiopsis sediminis]|uniref:DUF2975 domain-containing protein n=1 Tax=Nocardiopsis sediminis TaxID=1778267 RepID=A0ABV8FNT3_9ACTN